ncbi:unnamed protein product [Rotaria sordida]|uniref:Acetoacetyl-CoA synthetase n=1 Tax=Rotaria sordida TaxID=392033 RepID=A0A813UKV4_9BILA|nr:unnamed protein product [Rotaria sordida]CAF0819527.1 unnamed protein product [Rotaria sordida]CAF0824121.1 unnamed protein product [Rotaria sordida]CAF0876521.1 unnamed protein product [Rotaria sordida]CAF3702868.1 unnamed protein product [Rotaria sordida]
MSHKLWSPPSGIRTNIDDFRDIIVNKYQVQLETYWDLYEWSINNIPKFWEEFWFYINIKHSVPFEQVLEENKKMNEIPRWFLGAKLNYAENLLRFNDNRIAVYASSEANTSIKQITFAELHESVRRYRAALQYVGVKVGDRVAVYLPNCPEALIICLATASLGAIFSAASPDFGVPGVTERFSQIEPKVIFGCNAVIYNQKTHDSLTKLKECVFALPTLQHVVVIPYISDYSMDLSTIPNSVTIEQFLSMPGEIIAPLEFEQVPFNHPLFIIIHGHGGTLLNHLKEHRLHSNMKDGDILFYFTAVSWMMWNWLISSIALGTPIVLYDGSPIIPDYYRLWDLADKIGITIFGCSARYLTALEEHHITPQTHNKLEKLHTILSTGSPLHSRIFDYVYTNIKTDILLGSITGGTDIISCFAGVNPTLNVHRGEIQSPHLAMAIECWSEEGKKLEGDSGELVCVKPFPSMPVCFWNDPNGEKYHRAYFDKFSSIWNHSDFCLINPVTRGIVMLGRSDGTLNPNGIRFGSAEIYSIVDQFNGEILDSLCVAQRNPSTGDERVILFLKVS